MRGANFMRHFRKIFVAVLALCLVMMPCATAFAADTESSTVDDSAVVTVDSTAIPQTDEATEVTPRQSVGKLLSSGAGNFYGSGYVSVYLDSGNSWADIMAGTGGSSCTGSVSVSVKFPNGEWYELGTIMANADHTAYNEFVYCPKGTYLFYFDNSTNDWIQVYANIYD